MQIREELARTIAEDPNNIDKILKLSYELASLDKNNVRFSPPFYLRRRNQSRTRAGVRSHQPET